MAHFDSLGSNRKSGESLAVGSSASFFKRELFSIYLHLIRVGRYFFRLVSVFRNYLAIWSSFHPLVTVFEPLFAGICPRF